MNDEIRPFRIGVSQADLDDLRDRLARTRWSRELPGEGTGWNAARVGRLMAELMRRLGYDRYGVQGGDLGAYVAPEIAKATPENVVGVYVIAGLGFPTEKDLPEMTEDERAAFAWTQEQDFVAMEQPDHVAADMRLFFAKVR